MVRRVRTFWRTRPRLATALGFVLFLSLCAIPSFMFMRPSLSSDEIGVAAVAPVDLEGPAIERVAAVDQDAVAILFSEAIDPASVNTTDFALSPELAVDRTQVLSDGRTVVVVTKADSLQKPGQAYTLQCAAGGVSDLEGNANLDAHSMRFAGFGASGGSLSISHGSGLQRPKGVIAKHPDDVVIVDQLSFKATDGDVTVASLKVEALSTGSDLFADLVSAFLFEDNGDGVFQADGRDPQVGTATPIEGRTPGSPARFEGIGFTVRSGETRNVWVIYRLGNLAKEGRRLGSRLTPDGVTLSAGTLKQFSPIVSAAGGKTLLVTRSGPIMATGIVVDPVTVDVRFDKFIDPITVDPSDFKVDGNPVVAATPQPDGRTVRLRTSTPVSTTGADVQVDDRAVRDLTGELSAASYDTFGGPVSQTATDVVPPTIPTGVNAVAGSSEPTAARVTWTSSTDNSNYVAGYRVYRSTSSTGTFLAIGATRSGTSLDDTRGIPGQVYYYRVTAFDLASNESTLSGASPGVTATWTTTPHKSYSGAGNACALCHVSHKAATKDGILRKPVTGGTASEINLCYECHDRTGASTDIKNGATESYVASLPSGHWLEDKVDTTTVDLTNSCSDCHGPHQDLGNASLAGLWRSSINSHTVTGNNKTWCMACHDEKHTWAGAYGLTQAQYDAKLRTPSLATSNVVGYPTLGTYPGSDVVTNAALGKNPHASVQETPGAEAFACKGCHGSHRNASAYDLLRYRNTPTTNSANVQSDRQTGAYAQMCLRCHDGSFAGATNIKQWVTLDYDKSDSYAGHRIMSGSKSTLPTGTPLPCNGCHGAHGSRNNNANSITDNLGKNLSTADAGKVRAFCLSCHTTSDGMIWNSDTSATVAVGAQTFYGIPRNDQTTYLRITGTVPEHGNASGVSCYKCHGNDYSSPTKFNVHNPNRGESQGAMACGICHDVTTNAMKSASSYHHYVATDQATYPSLANPASITTAQRTCLTCHVDHDVFNKTINTTNPEGRSRNLRASIGSAPSSATVTTYLSTDFEYSTGAGVCADCHRVSTVKSTTGRKTDNTQTVAISSNGFRLSAHNYESFASTFSADNSRFRPNCSKCHNDTAVKEYQTTPRQYGAHDSTHTDSLNATTAVLPERPEQQYCYLCHSRANDAAGSPNNPNGGTAYSDLTTRRDFFGSTATVAWLDGPSLNTKGQFTTATIVSKHPVDGLGVANSSRVECENCHNPHKTREGANDVVVNPANTTSGTADGAGIVYYSTWYSESNVASASKTNRVYCLTCHDGSAPVAASTDSTYVPYTVWLKPNQAAFEINPSKRTDNKAQNVGSSHYNTSMSGEASAGATAINKTCGDCHDNHSSTLPALLGSPSRANPELFTGVRYIYNGASPVAITGNDNSVCFACHTAQTGSYPTRTTDTSGYPTGGAWPGKTAWDRVYSSVDHTGNAHSLAQWPTSGTPYPAGDCKNCHDVHGTGSKYDELRTDSATTGVLGKYNYSTQNFSFCFNCHDAGGPASADISQYYPASSGGTGGQAQAGHSTVNTGTLPAGSPVPCYTCHDTHGSPSAYSLVIRTQSGGTTLTIGDQAGELLMTPADTATPVNVRNFCFTCHVSSDDQGYNGSIMTTVTGSAFVLGIDRLDHAKALHLVDLGTGVEGHKGRDTAKPCWDCHATGGGYDGIHAVKPSAAISRNCYQPCHGQYEKYMEYNGTERQNSFHHVMGAPGQPGDQSYWTGSYPTDTQVVKCLSCHTDHSYSDAGAGSNRGFNLRQSIDNPDGSIITNTDYLTTGQFGICVSCHDVRLDRDTTNQDTETAGFVATSTAKIDGTAFNNSAHEYSVTSTFFGNLDYPNASTFRANCVKCHTENSSVIGKQQDPGTPGIEVQFATHYTTNDRNILAALGITGTDPLSAKHCYGCHSRASDGIKSVNGRDYYGAIGGAISTPAEKIYKTFNAGVAGSSSHPVSGSPNPKVLCENCHNPHTVSNVMTTTDPANGYLALGYGTFAEKTTYCLKCHRTASQVPTYTSTVTTYVPGAVTMTQPKMDKTAYEARSHWVANNSIQSGVLATCADCHDKHGSPYPKLVGNYDSITGATWVRLSTGATASVTGNNRTVCLACHNAAGLGAPAAGVQPTLAAIDLFEGFRSVTASGYFDPPASGSVTSVRWPGGPAWSSVSVVLGQKLSPHGYNEPATSPVNAKATEDCNSCHDVHGTQYPEDELVRPYTATDYTLCFDCHGGTTGYPAGITGLVNIAQYYPTKVGGKGNTGDNAGHVIKTLDPAAYLRPGDPLPCYDCHGTHGSANGNTYLVSDQRWKDILDPRNADSRRFCLGCHITSDDFDGEGRQLTASDSANLIEGFPRLPATRIANRLKIPVLSSSNVHTNAGTRACTEAKCHGNDYSANTSTNVHNPSPGISTGGKACYTCHIAYPAMEDDIAPRIGTGNELSYHHVLGGNSFGGSYQDGDVATTTNSYPTSKTDVYCISCHADHDLFNAPNKAYVPAANLRRDINVSTGATATSDFIASELNGGICISCHDVVATRQGEGTEQAVDASTNVTPKIPKAPYAASKHNYAVKSWYDTITAGTFDANCVKCHDDNIDNEQDSTYKFGAHLSAETKILAALGAGGQNPYAEEFCFRCHSQVGEVVGGKSQNGYDYYGSVEGTSMTTLSEKVYKAFALSGASSSKHPVDPGASGEFVECANCHNPHNVNGTNPVSQPSNTYNVAAYSTAGQKAAVCLDCHRPSAQRPVYRSDNTTFVPATVVMAGSDAAIMDKNTYATRGHWSSSATSAIGTGQEQTCVACHDKHASAAPKLLGIFDGTSANFIGSVQVTANDNEVCRGCHTNGTGSFPAQSVTASGFPYEGTWPGWSTYTQAYDPVTKFGSMHTTTTAKWPMATAYPYQGGDCKNCHDVHGTANGYDMLRTETSQGVQGQYTFSQSSSRFCFNCHDSSGPGKTNIQQYFPANVGGTADTGTRRGHQIRSAGASLPVGAGMPCYDCHNPHGSANSAYGLQIRTGLPGTNAILGDASGEMTLSPTMSDVEYTSASRKFCFACHTGTDGYVWTNTGYQLLSNFGTVRIYGLDRGGNKLKLSGAGGADHNANNPTGGSCFISGCHGSGTRADYTDASSLNSHNVGSASGGGDIHNMNYAYGTVVNTDTLGTGVKYVLGSNVGCFGCHVTDMAVEHGSSGGSGGGMNRTMQVFGGGTYTTTEDRCNACHNNKSGRAGTYNVDRSPAVATAYANKDNRCASCHQGGASNPRIPHSRGVAGNVTSFTADFQNWPQGGGHNALQPTSTKFFPKEGTDSAGNARLPATVAGQSTAFWKYYSQALLGPTWSMDSTVTCGDCHLWTTGSYPSGPQGAAVPIVIDPAYPLPYTSATTTNWATTVCAKCHSTQKSGSHSQHSGVLCTACHLAIPHGNKRPRLLRNETDVAPYVTANATRMLGFEPSMKDTATSWDRNQCLDNCGNGGGARHGGGYVPGNMWP